MSYFLKPSLNENDLAIIERGDTAAHSIDAGQHVSWHGKTGRAKAAILQGATLDDSLFDYDETGLFNGLIASILAVTTVFSRNGSWTNSGNMTKTYKITGNGLFFVNAIMASSTNADTGTVQAHINESNESKQTLDLIAKSASRVSAEKTLDPLAADACALLKCNGVRYIQIYIRCTRDGTNSWIHSFTAIGCTVTEI